MTHPQFIVPTATRINIVIPLFIRLSAYRIHSQQFDRIHSQQFDRIHSHIQFDRG